MTTLGRALANELAFTHHDTDDYYWLPTVPPFIQKRPVPDRIRLMHELFASRADWVLSGSMNSWGEEIHDLFDWIVFMETPTAVRIERLRERERRHFGSSNVAEGGWRHEETEAFLEWTARYEQGDREGRNRKQHEAWLSKRKCPVLRVDGTKSTQELVHEVLAFIGPW